MQMKGDLCYKSFVVILFQMTKYDEIICPFHGHGLY